MSSTASPPPSPATPPTPTPPSPPPPETTAPTTTATTTAAGELLLHPLSLAGLGGLLLNDHVLKASAAGTWFSFVTGKLSDVCGVAFLPILVVSGLELALAAARRPARPGLAAAVVAAAAVAVCFASMKTVPAAGDVYAHALGALQWPFYAVIAVIAGVDVPGVRAVSHVVDPSDVVAVPCAFLVVWLQRRRINDAVRARLSA